MNQAALISRFRNEALATASPATLLLRLYDRLVLDLTRAVEAAEKSDRAAVTEQVRHAQAIVQELLLSLDTEVWPDGVKLKSLYSYLITELIGAAATTDAGRITACLDLVTPLRDAWHQAASSTTADGVPVAAVRAAAAAAAGPAGTSNGDLGVA